MMLRGRGGDEGRTVPEKESWVSFVFFRLFYTFFFVIMLSLGKQA